MAFREIPGVPGREKKYPLPTPRKPGVVIQPQTYRNMQKGVEIIANAVRPTLGPLPRLVVMERLRRFETPEFLDDGATIARRVIQIKPRSADVGAMLIRRALWDMHLEVGDGTTTMAVIYQKIVELGIHYITRFGYNPILLRTGLEKGLKLALDFLRQEAAPLSGKENVARIALGMCQGNAELAEILGEIFDIVGPEGMIFVEGSNRHGLEREYIEGTYWKLSGWYSRHFINQPETRQTTFEDAALLITDLAFTDPNELVPVLEKCVKAGQKKLVILAKEISDSAIGLLVNNNRAKTIETMAVRTPGIVEMDRVAIMEDLAVMCGGKVFYAAAKAGLENFSVEELGQARRIWATESLFGLFGGKGNPRQVRQQIAILRGMIKLTGDQHEKEKLQARLGRLGSGTAILRLGAIHETEREALKTMTERAISGIRNAIQGGVAPGGGAALLNAQQALTYPMPASEEEAIAFRILSRALEEPMRVIAANAGYQPDVIVEKARGSPKGYGLDAYSGEIVEMCQKGILDSFLVLEKALQVAVSGAAMMLTTDVIIHLSEPVESVEP